MTRRASPRRVGMARCALALLALATGTGAALAADTPTPHDFAWRAAIEVPAGASLVRLAVPAAALTQLQGADAGDLRVFNAAGQAVAHARLPVPAPAFAPPVLTPGFPAFALHRSDAAQGPGRGAVRVRVDGDSGAHTVWVQLDGKATPVDGASTGRTLPSAIFDTRASTQTITALDVQATLPANLPVQVSVASSTDLANWSPVPVRGRLYRFDGADAPANHWLVLDQPLKLERRYLRLDWSGHAGVTVTSIQGAVAAAAPSPERVRALLPAPQTSAGGTPGSLDWPIPFATPIAALGLVTTQANTLVPVRILGRSDAAQPWRLLAQTVVYRLGSAGSEAVNPPVALGSPGGASVRWLRVETSHGLSLDPTLLSATVEFEPLQLVFLANGSPPFELAAGRAGTASAALPLATLTGALPGQPQDLPLARIGATLARAAPASAGPLAALLPHGMAGKTAALWGVLLLGVAVLGGVAWSLLRQLRKREPGT